MGIPGTPGTQGLKGDTGLIGYPGKMIIMTNPNYIEILLFTSQCY